MINKRLSMIAAIDRRYNHINELAAHGNSVTVSRIWQAPTMHHIRSPGRAEQYGLAHRVRTRGAAVHPPSHERYLYAGRRERRTSGY
jgi:hypothetical protein